MNSLGVQLVVECLSSNKTLGSILSPEKITCQSQRYTEHSGGKDRRIINSRSAWASQLDPTPSQKPRAKDVALVEGLPNSHKGLGPVIYIQLHLQLVKDNFGFLYSYRDLSFALHAC
jgi:hypothetical protein